MVAADRAALPETCGDAALLVDPEDREAIARALGRVLEDESLRGRLRESGLRRAVGFSWDRAAAELDALLGSLTIRTVAPGQAD